MKSLVKFTLAQSVLLNVVFVLLTVFGLLALFSTPVENVPPIDAGMVYITTYYYGASAEDVENIVTDKIEEALDGIPNIEYVNSESFRNYCTIGVKFIDDTDYQDLFDEVRFRVSSIQKRFPPEVEDPFYLVIDTHFFSPVINVNILGDIPKQSQTLLAEELKTSLTAIPDVKDVQIKGDYKKEFHVSVNPEKLRQYGITFHQVAEAINSANTKIPTGRFKKEFFQYMLDAGKKFTNQEDVLNVVVRKDGDGNFIRVRDLVTSARLGYRIPYMISSVNGKHTVNLIVKKETFGNSIKIGEEVKRICKEFEEIHKSDGVEIILTGDSTVGINDAINTLSGNMILGMILVTVVLWLTLGFRNAMLSAIGIPFSFLCAIVIMKFTGLSINSISLFAFVLISGIIVDDAIITIENVFRHQEMGKSLKDAVVDGVSEIILPVISSALTTILAFVPMLIMTGTTGEFFSVIPKTVSFALIASLFEALIILPLHILEWGPKHVGQDAAEKMEEDPFHHLSTGIFGPLWKIYYGLVDFLLNNKKKTVMVIAGLLFISAMMLTLSIKGIVPLIKIKFFPDSMIMYHVALELPTGTSIEKTDEVIRDLSEFIVSFGKEQTYAASGYAGYYEDESYQWHQAHNYGQVVVTLPPKKELNLPDGMNRNPLRYIGYVTEKLQKHIDETYTEEGKKPEIHVFPVSTSPITGKDVNIRLSGDSIEDNLKAADVIKEYLKSEQFGDDLVDLTDNRSPRQKVIKYLPRQEKAYEYRMTPGGITAIVAGALNGWHAGNFRLTDQEIPLMVRLTRKDDPVNPHKVGLSDPNEILNLPVVEHSMAAIYLRDLVDIRYATEPVFTSRFNGQPAVTITADIKEGSKLSSNSVKYLVNKYFTSIAHEHPGVTIGFGGQFESTAKAYQSLVYAFFLALLCIYMVLAAQFNDYLQPFIIITAVAFAFIGVVIGMFFTRSTFTIGSFMAVVGLAGVAVNDSLILVDFMNMRRKEGKNLRDAVIEACSARMRPVLITTITTILGLLPMAIGIPSKSIEWSPMATAFATGLVSATILTLLIIPVEYELAIMFNEKVKTYFQQKRGTK